MGRGKDINVRALRCDRNRPDDILECVGCGRGFMRSELSNNHLCKECGVHRVALCCRQMQNKRGGFYDRYLAGIERSKKNMKEGNHGKEND